MGCDISVDTATTSATQSLSGARYLNDLEDERGVLEIVLDAEVDLSNVLRGFRVVDVHVHQRYGPVLPECHLKQIILINYHVIIRRNDFFDVPGSIAAERLV